jgi:hypothetical protein
VLDGVFPISISSINAHVAYSRIIKRDQSMSFTGSPFYLEYSGSCSKYVAEYTFPGVITGYFTHLEYIKLAR